MIATFLLLKLNVLKFDSTFGVNLIVYGGGTFVQYHLIISRITAVLFQMTGHKNIGRSIIIKGNKTNGVNKLNSVQEATSLKKKIKSGNK